MLIKLVPEAITNTWGELSRHIMKSLMPEERNQKFMSRLLEELLCGHSTCWISYDSQANNRPNAVVVLAPLFNEFAQEWNLNVLAITRISEIPQDVLERMYVEGMAALRKYMRSKGFKNLIGHVGLENKYLMSRIKQLGFTAQYKVTANMEV